MGDERKRVEKREESGTGRGKLRKGNLCVGKLPKSSQVLLQEGEKRDQRDASW